SRTLDEIARAFADTGVLWGPYRDVAQLLAEDPRCSVENPLFHEVDQPSVGRMLTPRLPLSFSATPAQSAAAAPRLGQDTAAVLGDLLSLPGERLRALRDEGVIGGG